MLLSAGFGMDAGDQGAPLSRSGKDGIARWTRGVAGWLRSPTHGAEAPSIGADGSASSVLNSSDGSSAGGGEDGLANREAATDTQADPLAAARLEGVHLAGRTIAHLVNNDLTITVGALDLLRAHGNLPPHLHALLDTALDALFAATDHIDQVRCVTRIAVTDSPAGPALDLDRSRDVQPTGAPSPHHH